jgi:hypothetical protein
MPGQPTSRASETVYDEQRWIEAYAEALCHCKPSLDPKLAMQAARLEYPFQRLSNPKTAAALDATFGPIAHKPAATATGA